MSNSDHRSPGGGDAGGLDTWMTLPSTLTSRQDGSSAALLKIHGEAIGIVLAGGRSGAVSLKAVELLEWTLGRWWNLKALQTERAGCATAAVNGTILVAGGYTSDGERLDTAEFLEFGQDTSWQWTPEPMATPRWHACAVGLTRPTEVIVVMGGRDQYWKELNTVEAYDVKEQQWKTLPHMKTPRFASAAVAIGPSRIMVVGGFDGKNYLASAEAYDYNEGEWTELPPMPVACAFCSAVSVVQEGRFVLVFGGKGDSSNVVQFYSVRERAWRVFETESPMEDCIVASMDQNLVVINKESEGQGGGNITRSCSLSGTNIMDLWEEGSVSRTSEDGSQQQQQQRNQWQLEQQQQHYKHHAAAPHAASHNIPAGMAGLPVAHSVVAVPMDQASNPSQQQSSEDDDSTRNVENHPLVDNHGRDAWYTGEISTRTERPHGKGRMVWDFEGETYDGEWKQGARHGFGQFSHANGDSFEGFFRNDKKWGPGSYAWRDGRQFDGKFVADECEDKNGVMTWKDGTRYVGGFVKGQRAGRGRIKFPTGVIYEGDFMANKYEGNGTCKYADGRVYEGQFKRGKAHGHGKLTDKDGVVLYEGMWSKDAPA